ncbi:MAG: peptidase M48 [Candidatus Zixiibacteriota bacterium]|nr:MAG: peptidase M48 [candidate division Zixibacteria bacterium]
MNRHSFVMIVCLASLIVSCATTGPGGKKSLIFISTDQELSLGEQFDKQLRTENKIFTDSVWQNYFNEIGQSIIKVCDRKDIQYHFTVIESEQINAFATPGGYVYIFTGLLDRINNEAELAAVTAHEISHVVARHSVKRLQSAVGIGLLEQIAFGGNASATRDVINLGVGVALQGYLRANEFEADEYGIVYMAAAGYNPQGAIDLFQMLASLGDSGQKNIFERLSASHPDTQVRIDRVNQLISSKYQEITKRPKNEARISKLKQRLPKPAPEKTP